MRFLPVIFFLLTTNLFAGHSCPLTLEPGVRLGPVIIGERLPVLRKLLKLTKETTHGSTSYLESGIFRISLTAGAVDEVWLEDLRQEPGCIRIGEQEISPKVPVEEIPKLFGPCVLELRKGGTFYHCRDGTLHFGYGLGTFLQLRTSRKGKYPIGSFEKKTQP